MRNNIRVEVRIKNNILYKAIFSNYNSVAEFSEVIGLNPSRVGELISLKISPKRKDGTYRKSVKKICNHFLVLEEDFFPDNLYKINKSKFVAEISIEQLSLKNQRGLVYLEDKTDAIVQKDLNSSIYTALQTISEKEADIIRRRFGIDCEKETLESISTSYNVQKERIRQLEKRGLRKLSNPSRSKCLKEYYETM